MTKSDGSCHDSSHPSFGASVQPSLSFWKDPCSTISSPLLEAPLLLHSVSRHKSLGDLGSEPQSLEGIYCLCPLALNHPPCSQQGNISLVHSSTDDGAVTAFLALESLTNFTSSWLLAFLTLSLYIHVFLALLCHLSSHPSLVHLPSTRAQPALLASSRPRHLIGMQQKSWVLSPFAEQFSEVSKIASYFSLEE